MQNRRKGRREERRGAIRQAWETEYPQLVSGETTLARILGHDDARLLKLADKGLRLFKVGKLPAALKVFRGLVILDPYVPYFHYLLGSAYEKNGTLDRAAREYGTVLDLTSGIDPAPELVAHARLGLGRVLGRIGRIGEALEWLRRVPDGSATAGDPSLAVAAGLIAQHLSAQVPGSPEA